MVEMYIIQIPKFQGFSAKQDLNNLELIEFWKMLPRV